LSFELYTKLICRSQAHFQVVADFFLLSKPGGLCGGFCSTRSGMEAVKKSGAGAERKAFFGQNGRN
jgi:hypothetical protein